MEREGWEGREGREGWVGGFILGYSVNGCSPPRQLAGLQAGTEDSWLHVSSQEVESNISAQSSFLLSLRPQPLE